MRCLVTFVLVLAALQPLGYAAELPGVAPFSPDADILMTPEAVPTANCST